MKFDSSRIATVISVLKIALSVFVESFDLHEVCSILFSHKAAHL